MHFYIRRVVFYAKKQHFLTKKLEQSLYWKSQRLNFLWKKQNTSVPKVVLSPLKTLLLESLSRRPNESACAKKIAQKALKLYFFELSSTNSTTKLAPFSQKGPQHIDLRSPFRAWLKAMLWKGTSDRSRWDLPQMYTKVHILVHVLVKKSACTPEPCLVTENTTRRM